MPPAPTPKEKPEDKLYGAAVAARAGGPEVSGAFQEGAFDPFGSTCTAGPAGWAGAPKAPATRAGSAARAEGGRRPGAHHPPRGAGPVKSPPSLRRGAPFPLPFPGSSPAEPRTASASRGPRAREAETRRETSPGSPHPTQAAAAAPPAQALPPRAPNASRGPAPGDAKSAIPRRQRGLESGADASMVAMFADGTDFS